MDIFLFLCVERVPKFASLFQLLGVSFLLLGITTGSLDIQFKNLD
jgi:hypothetical protein